MHWFRDVGFLIGSNYVLQMDKVQAYFFRKLKYSNVVEDIATLINKELEVQDIERTHNIINLIIADLTPFIETTYKPCKNFFIDENLYSGCLDAVYPRSVHVYLTNRCYHRCRHCFKSAGASGEDLDYNCLVNFLQYIKGNTPNLVLTGGEPLLFPQIEKLIADFGDAFSIGVITSGYRILNLTAGSLQKIKTIQMSFYGVNEKEHNEFTGCSDSFEQVVNNLKRFLDMGINIIGVYQVKNTDIDALKKFAEFCIANNIKQIRFGEIVKSGRANNLEIWDDYDLKTIIKNIAAIKKEYHNDVEVIFDSHSLEIGKINSFFKCGAGKLTWNILETGKIIPCPFVEHEEFIMASMTDDSYKKLINEPAYYEEIENKWAYLARTNNAFSNQSRFCLNIG